MDLRHYDCITAAGDGPSELMQALYAGKDLSVHVAADTWGRPVSSGGLVCFLPHTNLKNRNYQNLFSHYVETIWQRIRQNFSDAETINFKKEKVLVIFASTKGYVEDYIWNFEKDLDGARQAPDPFQGIVKSFKEKFGSLFLELQTLVVSNACASSHVAIEMAEAAIRNKKFDHVIVIAGDLIGPFIYQGFQSLKVLSNTKSKPFSADRDGLQLGEAIAILVFGQSETHSNNIKVAGVRSETEGGSVTRPSMNGDSLFRAMNKVMDANPEVRPDFFMAHGTGTKFNDASEEIAVRNLNARLNMNQPIVGIKWSVGHTLGASGALDLIVATEILKSQKLFTIHNTLEKDSRFAVPILTANSEIPMQPLVSALVNSLGFGGIHAALLVERQRE